MIPTSWGRRTRPVSSGSTGSHRGGSKSRGRPAHGPGEERHRVGRGRGAGVARTKAVRGPHSGGGPITKCPGGDFLTDAGEEGADYFRASRVKYIFCFTTVSPSNMTPR